MKRNFSNFIDGYFEYACDDFCPTPFHVWTGVSIIAGALERKVWIAPTLEPLYPNMYILLVSYPQVGKSTALLRGMKFLEGLKNTHNHEFKIIPEQITEAALIDSMKVLNAFQLGPTVVQYSSGFWYASEASSSAMKNEHGDFNATLTRFYDCPDVFRKKIKGEPHPTEIPYISFNVLAGTTFDFLKTIINEQSVLGGLASRFIYVVSKEQKVRKPKWGTVQQKNDQMRKALLDDLIKIHSLKGKFSATPEFVKLWEEIHPEFDRHMFELSPKLRSLASRKLTNITKMCMILSAAEGDSMVLTEEHWHRAVKMIDAVTKDNAFILSSAAMANADAQSGINQIIMQTLKGSGGSMPGAKLRLAVSNRGVDAMRVEPSLKSLQESGQIRLGARVELLVDPDTCF